MSNDEYLAQWLIYHNGYERRSRAIFKNAIKNVVNTIPFENVTYENYKALIAVNINDKSLEAAYLRVYTEIGLIHGNRVGQGINNEIKEYSRPFFSQFFQDNILDWVRVNCGIRITSVGDSIAKKIVALIEFAFGENMSILQMRSYLRKNLDKGVLNKYEISRIVRTETTGAANHAAIVSGETSNLILDKVWISTKDVRTRTKPKDLFDHRIMDGVLVGQYEDFVLRSKDGVIDKIQYPGAPDGSPGDVIQCRCTFAFRPRKDKDGFAIAR